MYKKTMVILWILAWFLIPGAGWAENQCAPAAGKASDKVPVYTAQDFAREKARCATKTADFKKLRYSYTRTNNYDPYSTDDTRSKMYDAYKKGEYQQAISLAEKILSTNYVNLDAHRVSELAYEKLGNKEKAAFHNYMVNGLICSILQSGDGKTPQTAMVVIGAREEYIIIGALGLEFQKQNLIEEKNHNYDRMDCRDPRTNRQISLYFNIDIPFGYLKKQMENALKDAK